MNERWSDYTEKPCPDCGYALLKNGRCTGRVRVGDEWLPCRNSVEAR